MTPADERAPDARRWRGDRGTSMAVALVLLFTFTAGAIIWLGRNVDQTVALRSTAQSIAFQAARAGAQEISIGDLRSSAGPVVELDAARAEQTASERAVAMMSAYAVEGVVVGVVVDGDDNVTVTVRLFGPGELTVTGIGTARPESR